MPVLFSLVRMLVALAGAGLELCGTEQAVFSEQTSIKHHRTGSNSTQIL